MKTETGRATNTTGTGTASESISRGLKSTDYTVEELKVLICRYYMSYWNNRRICSSPTITLETNRGGVKNTPHSNISSQQITYNNKNGIHSGTLEERLILGAQQQLNAGISKEVVMQDLENNYKMIDKLNQISADKIEAGDLPELTYSRDNIENSLKNNENKSSRKIVKERG